MPDGDSPGIAWNLEEKIFPQPFIRTISGESISGIVARPGRPNSTGPAVESLAL